ncbi:hypothetical protein JOD54_005204 [Actinokineospora baliensis]|uniref:N,N-dimethylformamidase beta subunit family domain-containing protein n=1 Tax=Actinokineospora baliensis TaxID=547056 RepID=UPI001958B00C|nr:N,N-dimethylformamidase beta subunit family domain-containing protein [Actinokineospora baliensis]MBM7775000.1 hypothetical protein [Actinokineospora baliensis]
MGFTCVVPGGDGVLYAVTDTGDLLFYRDLDRTGTPRWANGGVGKLIGTGWGRFTKIVNGGDGVLYGITEDGGLWFYRDLARDGTARWANSGVGRQISTAWQGFRDVVGGGGGILYALTDAGDVLIYRDADRTGGVSWALTGQKIRTGWGAVRRVIDGGDGVIYGLTNTGALLFFRDQFRDGTPAVDRGGAGSTIGQGWSSFALAVGGGGGVIYAITPDGFLLFYKDLARDGSMQWANNGIGSSIGAGWLLTGAALTTQGYPRPLSVAPGERVQFHVSSRVDYDVTYLRLGQGDGKVVGELKAVRGQVQVPRADAWGDGCGWQPSFALTVPTTWTSGIYSARCRDASGVDSHLVFVVRPRVARTGRVAVLASTNTWNAYNDWGGRSKYSTPPGPRLSAERPNPWTSPVDDGELNHLTRAELWVTAWLESASYPLDFYSDADFHRGIPDFAKYPVVVLNTHPEYWTTTMLDRLVTYIAGGGSVLYLGGNGVFEAVTLDSTGTTMTVLGGNANNPRQQSYLRNLTPPRPERAVLGVGYRFDNYMTFAPYEVLEPAHRALRGTGLARGALIGQTGHNGPASGWEMDTAIAGTAPDGVTVFAASQADDRGAPPSGTVVLARGTNPGYGADMTFRDTPAGGIVFCAGSLSFGGSLAVDPALQRIVRNVLDESLGL